MATKRGPGRPELPWNERARELGFPDERAMLCALRAWGWSMSRIGGLFISTSKREWNVYHRLKKYGMPTEMKARDQGQIELRRQARWIAQRSQAS